MLQKKAIILKSVKIKMKNTNGKGLHVTVSTLKCICQKGKRIF